VLDAANILLLAFKAIVDGAISLAAGVLGVAESVLNAASSFLSTLQYPLLFVFVCDFLFL
jgi:hypothetical protein